MILALKHLLTFFPAQVALLLTALTITISAIQYRLTRRRERFEQTFKLLLEWSSPEVRKAKEHIRRSLKGKISKTFIDAGFSGLAGDDHESVIILTHLLEYIGTAYVLERLDGELLMTLLGSSFDEFWQILGHLVLRERALREHAQRTSARHNYNYARKFMAGFEHVAECGRLFSERPLLRGRRTRLEYTASLPPLS